MQALRSQVDIAWLLLLQSAQLVLTMYSATAAASCSVSLRHTPTPSAPSHAAGGPQVRFAPCCGYDACLCCSVCAAVQKHTHAHAHTAQQLGLSSYMHALSPTAFGLLTNR